MFPSKYKDNSEDSTGLLFMRAFNKWHTVIKTKLKTLNITQPQFVVLTSLAYLLQTSEEVMQAAIAKMAGMDVMTVSQIVTLLEKKLLIQRKTHSKDSRANSVFLTAEGQRILKKAVPLVEQIDADFFGVLKEDEETLKDFLKRL
ncbi:MAG: MarR family winged helix-turn-helix transcriptional regulator [Treponema sp.]